MAKRKGSKANRNIMNTPMSEISDAQIRRGKAYLDELLKEYGDTPLSQIAGMESVEAVSETWEDRPKSNIVKWMMEKSGRTLADIAEGLNCTTSYLNNKLHRDSFSLDDLIIVAYICGYTMTFTSNNPDAKERSTFQIDVQEYFGSSNVEALERLYEYERRLKDRKKAEYDELKAKLEQMKTEYGFED